MPNSVASTDGVSQCGSTNMLNITQISVNFTVIFSVSKICDAMNWKKLQDTRLPQFTIGHTYITIDRLTRYDNKLSNDGKNLNKHAYPLFKAGHVQNIEVNMDSRKMYMLT